MLGVCLKYNQVNYGSKLQSLATVHLFEQLGCNYEIIRYNKKNIKHYIKSLPRFLNFTFLNDRYDQVQRIIEYRRHPEIKRLVNIRRDLFHSFDEHFQEHLSEVYRNYDELKKLCSKKYDRVITCSDQLWSPAALGSGFYNLMFVPQEIPKVSWASSFGVSNIPWYQKQRTRRYLNRIEHISMRENRGAEIVKELTGRDVQVLMDPVFLYDKNEWNTLVPYSPPEWDNYIFCYFLGSNQKHRLAAKELSEKTGMKIVTLRHLDRYVAEDENFGDIAPYDVDPQRFLNILRNATYICTDSFHGTAFSILFEKQFLVFDRYSNKSSNSKNSRIDSVCSNLGLGNRRDFCETDILEAMTQSIDYFSVSEKVASYRQKSLQYLNESLNIK